MVLENLLLWNPSLLSKFLNFNFVFAKIEISDKFRANRFFFSFFFSLLFCRCKTPGNSVPTIVPKPKSPTTGTITITKPADPAIADKVKSYDVTCIAEGDEQNPIKFNVPADADHNAVKDVEGLKPNTVYTVSTIGLGADGQPVTLESYKVP
jgi:hypothetical protein